MGNENKSSKAEQPAQNKAERMETAEEANERREAYRKANDMVKKPGGGFGAAVVSKEDGA